MLSTQEKYLVLELDSHHKGNNVPSVKSMGVDEGMKEDRGPEREVNGLEKLC